MSEEIRQEMAYFALRVSYVAGLASNDKCSQKQAFKKLKHLWKDLKKKKKEITAES